MSATPCLVAICSLLLCRCVSPPPAARPEPQSAHARPPASGAASAPASAEPSEPAATSSPPQPPPLPADPAEAFRVAPSRESPAAEDESDAAAPAGSANAGGDPAKKELSERWCREQTGYGSSGPFESCAAELLGAGAVLLVRIVTECGGDSCDVRGWVHTRSTPRFVEITRDIGGTVAAAPSGEFLVVDAANAAAEPSDAPVRDPSGGGELILERIDLPALTRRPFAPCFSAVLSPRARSFLCRDRAGNVLRVPITGGRPELVVRSGVAPPAVDWVPYAYVYPGPVEFLGPERFAFTVQRKDGTTVRKEGRLRE